MPDKRLSLSTGAGAVGLLLSPLRAALTGLLQLLLQLPSLLRGLGAAPSGLLRPLLLTARLPLSIPILLLTAKLPLSTLLLLLLTWAAVTRLLLPPSPGLLVLREAGPGPDGLHRGTPALS